MVQGHANRPEINIGCKRTLDGLPEHCPLIEIRMQVLLSAVERGKGLIILQFAGSPEICELVDGLSVFRYELHDVTGLEIPMHQFVVPQMFHSRTEMLQNKQELMLRQAVRVFGVIENVEETAPGAELHNNHLATSFLVLLDGQQFHNVFMVDLLQGLEFSHLDICRPHVTIWVEGLNGHRFAGYLVNPLK